MVEGRSRSDGWESGRGTSEVERRRIEKKERPPYEFKNDNGRRTTGEATGRGGVRGEERQGVWTLLWSLEAVKR